VGRLRSGEVESRLADLVLRHLSRGGVASLRRAATAPPLQPFEAGEEAETGPFSPRADAASSSPSDPLDDLTEQSEHAIIASETSAPVASSSPSPAFVTQEDRDNVGPESDSVHTYAIDKVCINFNLCNNPRLSRTPSLSLVHDTKITRHTSQRHCPTKSRSLPLISKLSCRRSSMLEK